MSDTDQIPESLKALVGRLPSQDLQILAKIVLAQQERIVELERRIYDAGRQSIDNELLALRERVKALEAKEMMPPPPNEPDRDPLPQTEDPPGQQGLVSEAEDGKEQ